MSDTEKMQSASSHTEPLMLVANKATARFESDKVPSSGSGSSDAQTVETTDNGEKSGIRNYLVSVKFETPSQDHS